MNESIKSGVHKIIQNINSLLDNKDAILAMAEKGDMDRVQLGTIQFAPCVMSCSNMDIFNLHPDYIHDETIRAGAEKWAEAHSSNLLEFLTKYKSFRLSTYLGIKFITTHNTGSTHPGYPITNDTLYPGETIKRWANPQRWDYIEFCKVELKHYVKTGHLMGF